MGVYCARNKNSLDHPKVETIAELVKRQRGMAVGVVAMGAAATGALHQQGVLVTRGDAIENLARATDFVFDKTGTLTTGALRLIGVVPLGTGELKRSRDECLVLAAGLEAGSNHPIARALAATAPARIMRIEASTRVVPGMGVEGKLDGIHFRIGSAPFVAELHGHAMPAELEFVTDDVTMVALGDEHGWIALFTFADPLREHARHVMDELTALGKTVHLLSGDRPRIVAHVARKLGIAAQLGGVTPEAKVAYVQRLQADGAVVAMTGDGVNDAAGLAAADVAIAMGSGAEVTCGNSDVILLSNRLDTLLEAVRQARASLLVIRQNLAWAFAYNVVAVPLAACGYVSPLVAGIGMAASSTVVVTNALRLWRRAPPPQAAVARLLAPAG